MSPGVNVCGHVHARCPVMDCHLIYGVFLPKAEYSWDRLQIQCDPDQNEQVTEYEWINEWNMHMMYVVYNAKYYSFNYAFCSHALILNKEVEVKMWLCISHYYMHVILYLITYHMTTNCSLSSYLITVYLQK